MEEAKTEVPEEGGDAEVEVVLPFKDKEELYQTWMQDPDIQAKYKDVEVNS